jgi:adhesin/invasin
VFKSFTFHVGSGGGGGGGTFTVTTTSLPGVTQNAAYSATLASSGGTAPITWSITGTLPTGLSLSASAGTITGTPTATGTSTFTVQATDSSTPAKTTAPVSLSITVSAAGGGGGGGGGGNGGGGGGGGAAAPQIFVSQNAITLTGQEGSKPVTQSLSVASTVGGLTWTAAVSSDAPWLTVTPTTNNVNGSVTISANPGTMAAGTYTGTITFSGGSAIPATVNVTLTLTAKTKFALSATSLTFSGSSGNPPAAQQITVGSSAEALDWNATVSTTSGGNWLVPQFTSGRTLSSMSIRVNPTGLSDGSYQGTITFTAVSDPTITQAVNVTLGLGTAVMKLNPSSMTFATTAGVNPAPQTFQVQNTGSGVLGWTLTSSTQNGANWLTVGPATGTAPSTVTVTVNSTGLAAGSYQGTITITPISGTNVTGGAQTMTVGLAIDAPMVAQGGVVDGATFSQDAVASGSIASLFGVNLATTTATASAAPISLSAGGDPTTLALPTALGRTQVLVNNTPAPLFYVSPTQINFQMPPSVFGTNIPIVVVSNGVRSLAATVNVTPIAPRIFVAPGNQGAVLNQDSSANSSNNPASAGSVIQIFADGLGATNPPAVMGQLASSTSLAMTIQTPTVTVGGQNAEILFSGLAPGSAGLYQVNARVPSGVAAGSSVPLQIQVGSAASNTVTIAVH